MMPASASDLQTNVVKVLSAGGPPMTPPLIARALPVGGRPTLPALKKLLLQMARDGAVVRIAGRTDKYVAAPVEVWARSHLL